MEVLHGYGQSLILYSIHFVFFARFQGWGQGKGESNGFDNQFNSFLILSRHWIKNVLFQEEPKEEKKEDNKEEENKEKESSEEKK